MAQSDTRAGGSAVSSAKRGHEFMIVKQCCLWGIVMMAVQSGEAYADLSVALRARQGTLLLLAPELLLLENPGMLSSLP